MKIKTKQSKTDFQVSQLPETRKQVFFDVIKLHWRILILLAAIILVGVLPILVCLFFRDNYGLVLSAQVIDGKITPEQRLINLRYAHLICAGACWACLYIFAVAICIVVRIVRQLVWYEPIFIKEDLKMAFKNEYKAAAICATFAGMILMVQKGMLFVTDNVIVQVIPVALFITFIAMPFLLGFAQATTYEGKFFRLVKNGIFLYIKEAPKVLLFGLLLFTPLLFAMLEQYLIVKYLVLAAYIFVFEIFFIMMFILVCNHIFDKYINREQFPEIYKKGLYVEPDEQ